MEPIVIAGITLLGVAVVVVILCALVWYFVDREDRLDEEGEDEPWNYW